MEELETEVKGWHSLRPEDMGLLWEHFVLTEMVARLPTGQSTLQGSLPSARAQ